MTAPPDPAAESARAASGNPPVDDRGAAVDTLLRRAVAGGRVPGAAAAFGTPDRIMTVATGHARLPPDDAAAPARPETLYDLASLTKPLATVTLLLLARREKRLDLDRSLAEIFPEVGSSRVGGASLAHLASHTSGLPAWSPVYAHATGSDRESALRALLALPLERPPGTGVTYSCAGFLLLGMVLEAVLGEPLDASFLRRVAAPLGLEGELGFSPEAGDHRLAGGAAAPLAERRLLRERLLAAHLVPPDARHLPDDGNARLLGGVAGNAGLFGTARAVARLASEYLLPARPDGLLREDEICLATRRWTRGMEQERGLGWQLAATRGCSAGPALAPEAFGHTGFTGASVWVEQARRRVAVLLANRHHPVHRDIDLHPLRRRFHALAMS